MSIFIGTNFGHGASVAALNQEGRLVFAVEEGRLTGIKDTDQFPVAALRALLDHVGHETLQWAEGWNYWKRFLNKGLCATLKYGVADPTYFRSRLRKETQRFGIGLLAEREWRPLLGAPKFAGHHLAHAYSLLPWGLPKKSVIVVSDTTAESASISAFYWSGSVMQPLLEVPYPHSPGAAFHQMAFHVGFRGRTGPGKLMALAAYGEPKWLNELRSISRVNTQGFRFVPHRYPAARRTNAWLKFAARSASQPLRNELLKGIDSGEQARDLASSLQEWFTLTCEDIIKHALRIGRGRGYKVMHLGLAGGAALNCQTNGRIMRTREELDVESVTISPWSDDAGTAIGAAAWLFHLTTGELPEAAIDPFLGPLACSRIELPSEGEVQQAARILESGGIVALVSGRLEFGPRALGGRCLLGDPRSIAVKERLNAIKERPTFMPIAPVVFERDFSSYFSGEGSANMAWTVTTKAGALEHIPGAVHVDGQARVQVLREGTPMLLSRLLSSFRALTGTGALLLTSLNGKNEPLAVDVRVARDIVRRMRIEGMLCDSGWYPRDAACGTPAPELNRERGGFSQASRAAAQLRPGSG